MPFPHFTKENAATIGKKGGEMTKKLNGLEYYTIIAKKRQDDIRSKKLVPPADGQSGTPETSSVGE
jgi:hypothetical protein